MENHIETIEGVIEWLEENNENRLDPSKTVQMNDVDESDPNVILNQQGFSPAGSGEDREVYILPDGEHVAKIDVTSQEQNVNEINRWKRAEEKSDVNASEVFAPIVDYDDNEHKWVIVKKVETIGLMDDDWEKIDENTDYELLQDLGVENMDECEFGWYENEIVAYDYGH